MIIRLLIKLGWRGSECSVCGFCHAAHFDKNVQWHSDNNPCNQFMKK